MTPLRGQPSSILDEGIRVQAHRADPRLELIDPLHRSRPSRAVRRFIRERPAHPGELACEAGDLEWRHWAGNPDAWETWAASVDEDATVLHVPVDPYRAVQMACAG
jgi:hypothetical protein